MSQFTSDDRARIDAYGGDVGGDRHGRYCTVTETSTEGDTVRVSFDDGGSELVSDAALRPAPSGGPAFSDREHDTVRNIWGDDVPKTPRDIATDRLWEIKGQVTDAVRLSYDDDDMAAMGVLYPLEAKVSHVLSERGCQ